LKYAYYPGCTLATTGIEYGKSTEAVCEALGLELMEVEDWNCCGASSAHSLSHELSLTLPGRTVMQAQPLGLDMAVPCPACYQHTLAADRRLREDEAWREEMEGITGVSYSGQGRPRHLLEIFARDLDWETLKARVKRPLEGLKPVSYYGCVLVRPPKFTGWDDPEYPVLMDELLRVLGAEPLPWAGIVDCCGASLSLNRPEVVYKLVGRLIAAAEDAGANCIVSACGMCQINLDTRQQGTSVPIFYFTELIGLALGLPQAESWWRHHATDPRSLLQSLGLG